MAQFAVGSGYTLADLSFALEQLVAAGKTTVREIHGLIEHRVERIQQLRTELAALLGGVAPAAPKPIRKPAPAKVAKPKAVKPAAVAKPAAKPKRKFTMTPKAAAARKVQGQFMGYLRNFQGKERDAIKALAKAKGVPAAVAEMRKRLGK